MSAGNRLDSSERCLGEQLGSLLGVAVVAAELTMGVGTKRGHAEGLRQESTDG